MDTSQSARLFKNKNSIKNKTQDGSPTPKLFEWIDDLFDYLIGQCLDATNQISCFSRIDSEVTWKNLASKVATYKQQKQYTARLQIKKFFNKLRQQNTSQQS